MTAVKSSDSHVFSVSFELGTDQRTCSLIAERREMDYVLQCCAEKERTNLSAFAETHPSVVDALDDGGRRCEGPMVRQDAGCFLRFFALAV